MNEIIQFSNICKSFPKTKRYRDILAKPFLYEFINVLENINLSIARGEIFGLIGHNGAGKTTLLKIVGSLILPTSGSVWVCGISLAKDSLKAKQKVGYMLSHERSFYHRLTGRQNLEFFATLNNIESRQLKRSVNKMLELVDLSNFSELEFMKYSTGMQHKLSIARALFLDPEILILDEPTKSLDPDSSQELRDLIKNLSQNEGKTILMASHNLDEVEQLCDRVGILKSGKIRYCGPSANIKKRFTIVSKDLELIK